MQPRDTIGEIGDEHEGTVHQSSGPRAGARVGALNILPELKNAAPHLTHTQTPSNARHKPSHRTTSPTAAQQPTESTTQRTVLKPVHKGRAKRHDDDTKLHICRAEPAFALRAMAILIAEGQS